MKLSLAVLLSVASAASAVADRAPVLKQIKVPHDYYYREMYLPQLTTGPSAAAWSPDGKWLVYSMSGGLWKQRVDSEDAQELTAGPGYDYQPDWSPDGRSIVFVRYLHDAMELYTLDVESGGVTPLTQGGDVNLEPRWSPDGKRVAFVSTKGTGHFHIFIGTWTKSGFAAKPWLKERKSKVARYYYSPFDQQLSPAWSPDGRTLVYVDNPETAYGSGALWRRPLDLSKPASLIHREETNWKAAPDWSPEGKRVIYSSYAGRQSNQLWIVTADGRDYPLPMTFGDWDATRPRWSPDGAHIAYISNAGWSTAIMIMDTPGGAVRDLQIRRKYRRPMGELDIDLPHPARISVVGSDGRAYGPDYYPMRSDDSFDRAVQPFETHYFLSDGEGVKLPAGKASVTVWYGDAHAISRAEVEIEPGKRQVLHIEPAALDLPPGFGQWRSGDVHVHMNYGGIYRTKPEDLVQQARAEDLSVVFDLLVNKEQRVPDIAHFGPDPASTDDVLLLHSQEFHTSTAGHLGLLGLQYYMAPGFAAYPYTGAASLYPDNAAVADLAHAQDGLVGYVHPFDVAPDPVHDKTITNELPIDVALGKVDYYEVVGFSNHRESAAIWYRLLNCGFRLPAAGGTDAMTNYASLRGPVGLARTYVLRPDRGGLEGAWLAGLKSGRSMATNGPLIGFSVGEHPPGDEIALPDGGGEISYEGWLRSFTNIDHLDVVLNGEVVRTVNPGSSADIAGTLKLDRGGWLVLRAWNEHATPDVFDLYPYATTSPVYITVGGKGPRSPQDAAFFLQWIEKVRSFAAAHPDYNTKAERDAVLKHIDDARTIFQQRR
jgi:Tol biopolymer transport system component